MNDQWPHQPGQPYPPSPQQPSSGPHPEHGVQGTPAPSQQPYPPAQPYGEYPPQHYPQQGYATGGPGHQQVPYEHHPQGTYPQGQGQYPHHSYPGYQGPPLQQPGAAPLQGFGDPGGPGFANAPTQGWSYQQPDYFYESMPGASQTPPPPSAPVGPPPPTRRVSIEDLKESGGSRWWIWLLVAIIAGAIVIGGWAMNAPKPATTASPSPAPSTSSLPTPKGPQDDAEWVGDGSRGTWRIVSTEWSGDRVTLGVELTCAEGALSFQIMAYSNVTTKSFSPITSTKRPSLDAGRIRAGEKMTGYVTFVMPREDGTIYLLGRQASAISARGFKA